MFWNKISVNVFFLIFQEGKIGVSGICSLCAGHCFMTLRGNTLFSMKLQKKKKEFLKFFDLWRGASAADSHGAKHRFHCFRENEPVFEKLQKRIFGIFRNFSWGNELNSTRACMTNDAVDASVAVNVCNVSVAVDVCNVPVAVDVAMSPLLSMSAMSPLLSMCWFQGCQRCR